MATGADFFYRNNLISDNVLTREKFKEMVDSVWNQPYNFPEVIIPPWLIDEQDDGVKWNNTRKS